MEFTYVYDKDNNEYIQYEVNTYFIDKENNILYYFETEFKYNINLEFEENRIYQVNYFSEKLKNKDNLFEIINQNQINMIDKKYDIVKDYGIVPEEILKYFNEVFKSEYKIKKLISYYNENEDIIDIYNNGLVLFVDNYFEKEVNYMCPLKYLFTNAEDKLLKNIFEKLTPIQIKQLYVYLKENII